MAGSHGESGLEAIVLDSATPQVLQEWQGDDLASLAAPLLAGRIG